MIIEEIKNSIREIFYNTDSEINFYFESPAHLKLPYAILSLKDFSMLPSSIYDKQEYSLLFEITYQKSEENKPYELWEFQKELSKLLLPAIKVGDKRITLDEVKFLLSSKQLIMNFALNFYAFENDESEMMKTLDITIKEN